MVWQLTLLTYVEMQPNIPVWSELTYTEIVLFLLSIFDGETMFSFVQQIIWLNNIKIQGKITETRLQRKFSQNSSLYTIW